MEITQERFAGKTVVHLNGNLDISASEVLEKSLGSLIDSGEKNLVVDFAKLIYISSSGLRVFMTAANRLVAEKGTIALCGMNDQIKKVFEITGFTRIFNIFPTLADAVSA